MGNKQSERKGQFLEWHPPEINACVLLAVYVESLIQAEVGTYKIVLEIQSKGDEDLPLKFPEEPYDTELETDKTSQNSVS